MSPLAAPPDWSELARFHDTITRDELAAALARVYTRAGEYEPVIDVRDSDARIRADASQPGRVFALRLAASRDAAALPPRTWRTAPPAPTPDAPLGGLVIALDPGHIGGAYAQAEARYLRAGDGPAIAEGDLTLIVARLLAERLERLGARVALVRDAAEPVTETGPEDLMSTARAMLEARGALRVIGARTERERLVERTARELAYRSSEIRARAALVNERIRPDLAICIHFNAESQGDGIGPLTDRNHVHVIVNGAYTADELALDDVRFELMRRLLARTHEVELALARSVATALARATGLGPESYPREASARKMSDDGYIWARNLLANRTYDAPVVYLEPYVMNNREVLARLQAGDYDGERLIRGAWRRSIFREYADAVVAGLLAHYAPRAE